MTDPAIQLRHVEVTAATPPGPRPSSIALLVGGILTVIMGLALLPYLQVSHRLASDRALLALCRERHQSMCRMVQVRLVLAQEIAREPFELDRRKGEALAHLQEVLSYAPHCIVVPPAARRALRDAAARGDVTTLALQYAIAQVAAALDRGARTGWPPPGREELP